jgi:hypothetical protein
MEAICSWVTSVTTYQSTWRNPRRLALSPKPQNLVDLPLLSPAFLFHWSSSLFCVVPAIREECVTRQRWSERINSQQAWNFFKIRPSSWLDSLVGLGLLYEVHRSHSDKPHSVGLLWTSDQTFAETSTWQHTPLVRHTHSCRRRD